jgi:hypothetical protein
MNAIEKTQLRQVCCPKLPLAVYREIAAHLQQVEGIETELIARSAPEFDYDESQIAGLQIKYADEIEAGDRNRVEAILAYYSQLHGEWLEFGS